MIAASLPKCCASMALRALKHRYCQSWSLNFGQGLVQQLSAACFGTLYGVVTARFVRHGFCQTYRPEDQLGWGMSHPSWLGAEGFWVGFPQLPPPFGLRKARSGLHARLCFWAGGLPLSELVELLPTPIRGGAFLERRWRPFGGGP